MERYHRVHGHKRVKQILEAVEASNGAIVKAPSPTTAPFEFTVRAPGGILLNLTCYAFTANKYMQKGRPPGEHRFQVKYGREFHRPHRIFVDPTRAKITLMFGVHEDLPLFVAIDPAMHETTWFSRSVEFKEVELKRALKDKWHGWERDRVAAGRRRVLPQEDLRTEVLLAFGPDQFLNYALFERIATGMDPGERLMLIDRLGDAIDSPIDMQRLLDWFPTDNVPTDLKNHPLLLQLGLTASELLAVLGERFRLMAAVRGSVAELHLERLLRATPGITELRRLDQDGQPDFEIRYKKRLLKIECKNVLRRHTGNVPRVDFQKTRASKSNPCSRYYQPQQFEILAACLHPLSGQWNFQFCPTSALEPHPRCLGRLSDRVKVMAPNWSADLAPLLDRLSM